MRAPALLTAAAVLVTVALLALPGPAAARAPVSYSTPGYHGTHKVPKVTERALPPVTIGVGQDPPILDDAAGTSHIVWDQPVAGGADQLHYCRLPCGAHDDPWQRHRRKASVRKDTRRKRRRKFGRPSKTGQVQSRVREAKSVPVS